MTTPANVPYSVNRVPARPPVGDGASSARRPGVPRFTAEQVLIKLQEWAALFGEPPTIADWEPSRARRLGQHWRAERYVQGDWPTARMVRQRYPTFNDAVVAAGLVPRRRPSRLRPKLSGPEQVLDAIREWTRRYGEPPTQADWDPVRARRLRQNWRVVRYSEGDWPSLVTTMRHFGSLSEAITAAGLHPRRPGDHASVAVEHRSTNRRALARAQARQQRGDAPAMLREQVTRLVSARQADDPQLLHGALIDLAGIALYWADEVGVS